MKYILAFAFGVTAMVFGGWLGSRHPTPRAVATVPVLKTWVHTYGCPGPTNANPLGTQDLVLVYSDGSIQATRINRMTDAQLEALTKFVGEIKGTVIMYECGTSS